MDGADNFKLTKTHKNQTPKEYWQELISHKKETLLKGFELFENYLVIEETTEGLDQIQVIPLDNPKGYYYLPFDSETYAAEGFNNVNFKTDTFRYSYSSMTCPKSVLDFNMRSKEKKVLQQQEVLGGKFYKTNYQSERIWVSAIDGSKIPISLVYKKGIKKDGSNPTLLYGYGSYGHTISPVFSSVRLSLLDRGFIFAIGHIRGGEYMGRQWYEDGKLLVKKNTFTDFIACGRHLVSEGYTCSKHLYAMGGSAGGLLIGSVINIAPKLFNGVIASVPFVDVLTTMLDDKIPLTTGEYDEWGDPNKENFYQYMKSYSPYDNVEEKEYPNILVTAGYHDSQVQYWESAKWVAKLRALKTDNNKLLLLTNMDAGHGGASGRFQQLKEVAMEYAFLLGLESSK
ncbi:protease 2 [Elysia marginata]|uniref:Prolyl endopeptidase n=1 Tax=Elysia marginata TaxID=1093978 RepID=A0AAV4GU86_9GAST|nr:protease 2 [Elysia marginata]